MSKEYYTNEQLELFKKVQSLAYEAALYASENLYEGITEKEAASLMEKYLKQKDVQQYFHLPFAWFGDRTAFNDFSIPLSLKTHQRKKISLPTKNVPLPHFGIEFMPSSKKLEKGMPVILDVAPCIDGCAADIGYTTSLGENLEVKKAKKDLLKFRSLILEKAKAGKTMAEIYHDCDRLMIELGYDNCHSLYPLGVLGHKVGVLPFSGSPKFSVMGFHAQTFLYLGMQKFKQFTKKDNTPFWNSDSHCQLEPGLWAVEPHIGMGDVGVKFEEILVVTDNDIYWLDDNLPHMNLD